MRHDVAERAGPSNLDHGKRLERGAKLLRIHRFSNFQHHFICTIAQSSRGFAGPRLADGVSGQSWLGNQLDGVNGRLRRIMVAVRPFESHLQDSSCITVAQPPEALRVVSEQLELKELTLTITKSVC